VPVGLLLGPMVMTFVWLKERVDPASKNPPPGSSVRVVATVDSDLRSPVTLSVPPPLSLDDTSPPARTLPPIRETLEHLLALYRQPRAAPSDAAAPWELRGRPPSGGGWPPP